MATAKHPTRPGQSRDRGERSPHRATPIFCLLLTAIGLNAQTSAPKRPSSKKATAPTPAAAPAKINPDAVPLASIQVAGNKFYKPDQVIGASGLKIGQPMKQAGFDEMKARLEQTGAFEVVSYRYDPSPDGKGYALKIEVVEALQLFPFRFEDLPATDAELRKVLEQKQPLFAVRIPPSRPIMDQFAATLTEYLAAKNYKDTVVGRVIPEAPDLGVVFRPATAEPMVGQFVFKGHKLLDTATLANSFAQVIIGTSSKEREVRALLDSGLRPLFEAKGLMRVTFPKIASEKMKDADGAALTIEVVEGPQFKWGAIHVTGLGLTNKDAMSNIDCKPGEIVNMDLAPVAVKKLKERLRHFGYMASNVTFEKKIDDKALTVDISFKLDPGPRYAFDGLTITGLDITTEPFVRKMWGLEPGKPYNADYPQHFLDEVKEQGILDNLKNTTFEEKVDKAKAVVTVTLVFVGGSDKPAPKKSRELQNQ